ncbi:MAG: hypothetical protein ACQCN4_08240 [Candidatus Bathyarchaeia archaeon]
MAKYVLTDEERGSVKAIALELLEIRKLLNELAETLVKISDKDFLKALNASPSGVSERQVDCYRLSLEKQLDAAENELH